MDDPNQEDMYSDAPPSGAEAPPQETEEQPSDEPTAVISKSAFGGRPIQPGDAFEGRVLRVNEQDVEVQLTGGEAAPQEEAMGSMME
jgi:hypothetical protein